MAGENGIDKGLSLAKFLKFQIRRKSLVRKPAGNDLQSSPFSFPWSIIARILSQRKKFPFDSFVNQNSFVLETSSAPFRSLSWPTSLTQCRQLSSRFLGEWWREGGIDVWTGSYWNFRENRKHTRRWRAVSARTGLNEERSSRGQVIDSDCEEPRAAVCVCVCARAWPHRVIVAVARGVRGGEEQDGTLPDSRLSDRAAHPLALDQEQAQSTDRADALRRGAGGRTLLRIRQVPQADRRLSRDTVRDPSDRGQQIFADQGVQSVGRSQVSGTV